MSETSYLPSLLAALVAVFAHASFQLGVSVLTLLSSHSIGLRRSNNQILVLGLAYVAGALLATLSLLSILGYMLASTPITPSYLLWASIAGLNAGVGVAVILFYYRKGKGTMLWIPRSAAEFLSNRTKKTKQPFEALGLGVLTVFAELPFVIAPVSVVALLIHVSAPGSAFSWTLVYTLLVCTPLLVLLGMIGSGHRISTIQRWREANKTFLQFSGAGALIVLGCFLIAKFGIGASV